MSLQVVSNQQVSDISVATLLTAVSNSLDQCDTVLSCIPDPIYRESVSNSSSIGCHFRHIIERFNCLLNGIGSGQIDYDSRTREKALELERTYAAYTFSIIKDKLSELNATDNGELSVIETVDPDYSPVAVTSSVERELMGLISHTTHHLAIIAMLMKARDLCVASDIGKAPSTILFEKSHVRQ